MKHLVRLLPILVVVVLVLSMPLVAFAQDPLCEGISDADCESVLAALETISSVESFTVPAWEFSLEFDAGEEPIELSAAGSAGFVITDDAASSVVHIKVDSLEIVPEDPSMPSSVELIFVGGFGYVNYDGEWYGEELTADDLADLDDMLGSVESVGVTEMDESMGIDLTGVFMTTREADEEMHGQAVAVYAMEVDILTLIVNFLGSPMGGEALGMSGMGEMSAEDMAMLGPVIGMLLGDSGMGAGLAVGQDDGYIHALELWLDINVNLAMMDPEAPPIVGSIYFGVEVSDVDAGYSVEPPAEYGSMDELEAKLDELDFDPLGGLGGLGM